MMGIDCVHIAVAAKSQFSYRFKMQISTAERARGGRDSHARISSALNFLHLFVVSIHLFDNVFTSPFRTMNCLRTDLHTERNSIDEINL